MTDGEVNPPEGKVNQEGRLDWRKLSLVLGMEPMILLIRSFEMTLKRISILDSILPAATMLIPQVELRSKPLHLTLLLNLLIKD